MSGPLFQLPKVVPLSSTGALLAGARLNFYSAGTSTRQNTYQDADLTTAHANPVVADAYGVFAPIYLSPALGDYKVVLTTSADVVLYTVDNIAATFSSAAIALSLDSLARTALEIAASVTPTNYAYPPGDLRRYGAAMNGSTDDTAALNSAIAVCNAGFGEVYIPSGTARLTSAPTTLTASATIRGDGALSVLKPVFTGGAGVITIQQGTNFVSLQDFSIDAGTDQATFLTGGINGQACIGIRGLSAAGNYTTRWHIKNVQVRGLLTGVDINGFIGTADKLQIHLCETGFIGTNLNAVRLNAHIENCRKDFAITAANGLLLDNCTFEGACANTIASTLDDAHGVVISAPYWEHATNTRAVPFATFGGTTECAALDISGALLGNGSAHTHGVALLKFDRVNGAKVRGYFGSGAYLTNIETTANTKNLELFPVLQVTSWPQDNSKALSRAENVWPNPRFDAWFRGWTDVTLTGCTRSQETTLVRRGPNALRLTCTASAGSHYATLYIDGAPVTALRGKEVIVGAWVYVPNIAAFNPASRTAYPWIQVQSYNGSVTESPSSTDNNHATRLGWQFMWSKVSMQSDATRLVVNAFVNNSGNTLTTSEYIVIDSIYVCEGGGQHLHAMLNGQVDESGLNPCRLHGGLVELLGTAAPTDADQSYVIGDRVWKTDVAAGGSPGWVCTTAGSPGTWKAMANVAA